MWNDVQTFTDIKYQKSVDGIAKITINRPEVRNAFRPQTVKELLRAFDIAHEDPSVGVIILTGEGDRRSAPAATRRCAATPDTSVAMACRGSMCSICRRKSAACRNR